LVKFNGLAHWRKDAEFTHGKKKFMKKTFFRNTFTFMAAGSTETFLSSEEFSVVFEEKQNLIVCHSVTFEKIVFQLCCND
jgi:hypothetical protein